MKKKLVDIYEWWLRNHFRMLIFAWCLMGGAWLLVLCKLGVYAIIMAAVGLLSGIMGLYGASAKLRRLK